MPIISSRLLDLNQIDILNRIPHRFENVLIDSVTLREDLSSADFFLSIAESDPLGRDIFFDRSLDRSLLAPTIMEILALASIVSAATEADVYIPLFAAIYNFERLGMIPIGSPIKGHVTRLRGKSRFLRYEGVLLDPAGSVIARGEMMAFYITPSHDFNAGERKSEVMPTPAMRVPVDPGIFLKSTELVVINEMIFGDSVEKMYGFRYQYPSAHPFVKGHFPGDPVMMGIMQWMAVEDSVAWVAKTVAAEDVANQSGIWSGDAKIVRNGSLVAEICGFKIDVMAVQGKWISRTISVDKVIFRDRVFPDQVVDIWLNSLQKH